MKMKWYVYTKWFAWFPVRDEHERWVWLKFVYRRFYQDQKIDFAPVEKHYITESCYKNHIQDSLK